MAFPSLNLNLDVNQCFGGLWKSWRQPKTDVEKLMKDMEKLKAKRNDIKSKIDEVRRRSRLSTAEHKQWQHELESLEEQVAAIFDDFARITFHDSIKIGPWGHRGEHKFDIGGSAFQITKVLLRHGCVVDSLEVSYVGDRNNVETSLIGGGGGHLHSEFKLLPGEYINALCGCVCEFLNQTCISQLEFRTNFGKHYGPFGGVEGEKFNVPVHAGRIVGFFGHFGNYLNEIGVYLASN